MENTINDCFVDVIGRRPTDDEIRTIYVLLPDEVVSLAKQWGWRDTEVRGKVFRWIESNVKKNAHS